MNGTPLNIDIHCGDCLQWTQQAPEGKFHVSFLDPPFNQGKDYRHHNDSQEDKVYWEWMTDVLAATRKATVEGGYVYFMQREKNAEFVLRALRQSGWTLRNLIIWKKMTSAVPSSHKFGLCYQIIAAAINGKTARLFHRLRIPQLVRPHHKLPPSPQGTYVTDIWDDIRELTSGYFAGPEAIRNDSGERFHKQQAPLALLARIILASSSPADVIFDPFAGTGTTLVAAALLGRKGIGVELDPLNVRCIQKRAETPRQADGVAIQKLYRLYAHTDNFSSIWGSVKTEADLFTQKHVEASLI